jgi:hypothetical protein
LAADIYFVVQGDRKTTNRLCQKNTKKTLSLMNSKTNRVDNSTKENVKFFEQISEAV